MPEPPRKSSKRKWIIGGVVAFLGLGAIGSAFGGNDDEGDKVSNATEATTEVTEADIADAATTVAVATTEAAPVTTAATTTTAARTGTFSECPAGQEFNDPDGDGWGGCTIPTTTTTDPSISEGVYIVGAEIKPGLYRVSGYWARLDANMEIIANDGVYDNGVGLLNVRETDAYIEIKGGALPLENSRTLDPVVEGYTAGTYLVNWDIQPGRYRITPTDGTAYFSRLDANGEIIDNNIGDGQLIVIVEPTDWAIQITGSIEPLP